ncbi:hypothetical protein [Streptomyces sp. T028]|uniref:hypothetical protein n=1 Tax=Streptomyces sp. T028 TaxID=3394379 RepID=UPI003A843716
MPRSEHEPGGGQAPATRIEVRQSPGGELVAWQVEGPWDPEALVELIVAIDEELRLGERLGMSLWDVAAKKASAQHLDYQVTSRPRARRVLTYRLKGDDLFLPDDAKNEGTSADA